jgi:cysteine desulfurase
MALRLPVYLDNHATTQPDPRVVDAMLPFLREHYGNAASKQHEYGWIAEAAVELARAQVASLLGATAREVTFTSGATESINLALKGIAEAYAGKGKHIVTAATEHRAVLDTCRSLERAGFSVTYVPVGPDGLISAEALANAVSTSTILVSIMAANNEIGTIAPLREIGSLCRERRILFHTDATQAVGKIPLAVSDLPVDLMSFSAHKMHGPKGVGGLYVRASQPAIRIVPHIDGGGHESGLRSGTLDVPGIVGFGKAAEIAKREMGVDMERVQKLRDRLHEGLRSRIDGIRLNGHPALRLPNNLNVVIPGTRSDRVMMDLKSDVAVASGSACSSASPEPSHVLRALGMRDSDVRASLRFGLSKFTTEEEIEYAIERVAGVVRAHRASLSSLEVVH